MKRRQEHLVQKRDGRTEFLRATKLARSIDQAMRSVGVDESWRALELANVVLAGLRQDGRGAKGGVATATPMTTVRIADAVQNVLVATGQPSAAVAYGATGAERARRHRALATFGRGPGAATDTMARPTTGLASRLRRFGQE